MRKTLSLAMALAIIIALCACGNSDPSKKLYGEWTCGDWTRYLDGSSEYFTYRITIKSDGTFQEIISGEYTASKRYTGSWWLDGNTLCLQNDGWSTVFHNKVNFDNKTFVDPIGRTFRKK